MGKQRNVKKGEKMGKHGLVHLHFCCFFDLLFFCFCFAFLLLLFCFLPGKKQNKSKIKAKKSKQKANQKSKKKAKKKMQMDKSIFSHFFPFLSFLFSLLFCFCVFWILLICFLFFPFCLHFSRFFSSFLKKRINGGLVNIMIYDI